MMREARLWREAHTRQTRPREAGNNRRPDMKHTPGRRTRTADRSRTPAPEAASLQRRPTMHDPLFFSDALLRIHDAD